MCRISYHWIVLTYSMHSVRKLLIALIYCLVQGNAFKESFEKLGAGARFKRVGIKADIVSVPQCASMCVNIPDCDGIQYFTNKTCLFLANIEEPIVIDPSLNAYTYVRKGRLMVVGKLVLFLSLNILFVKDVSLIVIVRLYVFPKVSFKYQDTKLPSLWWLTFKKYS